ncbi:hypothetical protein CYMTET_22920 [Cymbomonas tetramitiformis]|uniref:Uncharacterized protein n=1 Tax=Cymbomonas tetramitiformis TaxID=36881 RepID=A0AAE0L1M3_9CHLO|nr:hypothetical protein CYMTET_22920 [Cymbomonas tetramitiformis]
MQPQQPTSQQIPLQSQPSGPRQNPPQARQAASLHEPQGVPAAALSLSLESPWPPASLLQQPPPQQPRPDPPQRSTLQAGADDLATERDQRPTQVVEIKLEKQDAGGQQDSGGGQARVHPGEDASMSTAEVAEKKLHAKRARQRVYLANKRQRLAEDAASWMHAEETRLEAQRFDEGRASARPRELTTSKEEEAQNEHPSAPVPTSNSPQPHSSGAQTTTAPQPHSKITNNNAQPSGGAQPATLAPTAVQPATHPQAPQQPVPNQQPPPQAPQQPVPNQQPLSDALQPAPSQLQHLLPQPPPERQLEQSLEQLPRLQIMCGEARGMLDLVTQRISHSGVELDGDTFVMVAGVGYRAGMRWQDLCFVETAALAAYWPSVAGLMRTRGAMGDARGAQAPATSAHASPTWPQAGEPRAAGAAAGERETAMRGGKQPRGHRRPSKTAKSQEQPGTAPRAPGLASTEGEGAGLQRPRPAEGAEPAPSLASGEATGAAKPKVNVGFVKFFEGNPALFPKAEPDPLDSLIGRRVACEAVEKGTSYGWVRGVLADYDPEQFAYVVRYLGGSEKAVVLPDAAVKVQDAPCGAHSLAARQLVELANYLPPGAVRTSSDAGVKRGRRPGRCRPSELLLGLSA